MKNIREARGEVLEASTLVELADQTSQKWSFPREAFLATMAAGVACEHDGNTPVTPEQVLGKIAAVEKQVEYA